MQGVDKCDENLCMFSIPSLCSNRNQGHRLRLRGKEYWKFKESGLLNKSSRRGGG